MDQEKLKPTLTAKKKNQRAKIHGNLYTTETLRGLFRKHQFDFEKLIYENGALLYFKAQSMDDHAV